MIVNIVGCAAEVHRLPYIGTVDIVAWVGLPFFSSSQTGREGAL